MATTNFVDSTTLTDDGWFNDVDQVVYEQHGVGKTTVASATTPDIFAATVGNFIDYTGTATCTGFVAAVSAGSHRTLYCAGACLFTAGANLLIEGVPSGTTITLAAGAIVKVYAITTTQFKMTYSVSGTFTATGTGFTVSPTGTAAYKVENGYATLYLPPLSGTSNATTFTVTGLPAAMSTSTQIFGAISSGVDFGAETLIVTAVGATTIYFYKAIFNGAWTASGTKQSYAGVITFRIL